jgi:hypothetical protein
MRDIIRTDEIVIWIKELDDDAKEAILKSLIVLKEIGSALVADRLYDGYLEQLKEKNESSDK